jgi:hypothetical protein
MKLYSEAEFLDEIQTKVLRVFLLAIHRHHYSFALRFLVLQTHATSYSFYSSCSYCTLHERRKKENLLLNHIMPRNLNEFSLCCGNVVTMYCMQYKYCMYSIITPSNSLLALKTIKYRIPSSAL